jgi:16S rRNA A1518/A1519 N6-dimethyltransferase RsmA/KsgA/DIM1 with predicted DNA glycosylase/AP lyase activity
MADTIRPFLARHVLEMGASMGNLARLLVPCRKRYVATDVDREPLQSLRTGFRSDRSLRLRNSMRPWLRGMRTFRGQDSSPG